MKERVGVCAQPRIDSFVNAVVVQDHVHFFLWRQFCHHLIHELQKLHSAFELGGLRANGAGSHFQGGKKIQGSMPSVGALESLYVTPMHSSVLKYMSSPGMADR